MWLQCASRTVLGLVIGTVLLLTVHDPFEALQGVFAHLRLSKEGEDEDEDEEHEYEHHEDKDIDDNDNEIVAKGKEAVLKIEGEEETEDEPLPMNSEFPIFHVYRNTS